MEALSGRASLKFKLERSMNKPKVNILLRARNRATRGGVNPVFQMTLNRKCNPTIVKDFATLLLAGGDPGVNMGSTPDGSASAALGWKAGAWSETHLLAFDVPRHSVKKFPSVPTPQKGFEKDPDCRGPLMDGDVVYSQAFWDFEKRLDNDDLLNAVKDEGWDDQSRMCPPPDKTREACCREQCPSPKETGRLDAGRLNLCTFQLDRLAHCKGITTSGHGRCAWRQVQPLECRSKPHSRQDEVNGVAAAKPFLIYLICSGGLHFLHALGQSAILHPF